jgi:hypothetical protein
VKREAGSRAAVQAHVSQSRRGAPIGEVPVTKWRVEHSREVTEKDSKTIFSNRGRQDLRDQLAAMRKLAWRLAQLDPQRRPTGRPGDWPRFPNQVPATHCSGSPRRARAGGSERNRAAPAAQATAAGGATRTEERFLENSDLPRSVELGYYREMARVQRTLTLPSEGYGHEPKSEADVLLTAAARVQVALPAGWTVQTKTEVGGLDDSTDTYRRPDSRLSLMREGKEVVTYVVEAKRSLTSNNLLSAINQLLALQGDNSARMRPMLIARYLSSQQQDALQERGIAYADATGNLYLTSDDPLILLSDRGASADPWRGPGRPTTSLKGLPAAKLARALAELIPPYSVAVLGKLAGSSIFEHPCNLGGQVRAQLAAVRKPRQLLVRHRRP